MRKLLGVPILHTEADLGSLGGELARQSIALCGEERWASHRATVARFWKAIAGYLLSLDAASLAMYQDGLAVGGDAAVALAAKAAARGSPNFQLLRELAGRGAALRKTEDPALLLAERETLMQTVRLGEGGARAHLAAAKLGARRDELARERDQSVASAIDQTLREDELGVLFLGAEHDVLPYLAPDIQVCFVVDPRDVQCYLRALVAGGDDDRWQEMADTLASPLLA